MRDSLKQRCVAANDLDSIHAVIDELADSISAPAGSRPGYNVKLDDGCAHLEHDAQGFHYIVMERGIELQHVTSADPFEILYLVFQSITFGMACNKEARSRVPGQDFRRRLFQFQLELLGELDPVWQQRCEIHKNEILRQHPYDDLGDTRRAAYVEIRKKSSSDNEAWQEALRQYPMPAPVQLPPVPTPAATHPNPPPFHPPPPPAPRRPRLICYVPLLALVAQVAWFVVLFLGLIFTVGDTPYVNTPAKDRLFDFLASWPSTFGLITGIVALTKRSPTNKLDWTCLIIGTTICALAFLGFAWGLVN